MRPLSNSDVFVNPKNVLGSFLRDPTASLRDFRPFGGSSIFLSSLFLLFMTTFRDLDAEWARRDVKVPPLLNAFAEDARVAMTRSSVKTRARADIFDAFVILGDFEIHCATLTVVMYGKYKGAERFPVV